MPSSASAPRLVILYDSKPPRPPAGPEHTRASTTMIQSQTVVPVEFTSANRRLAGWHDQYRIMSHCHDSQFAIAWPDCQLFAQAHMAGAGHAMYVVPVPPYSVPGPAGYAIVDMDTEGAPSVRTTSIRTPYDTYPGALLTAAAIIAAEHIDSEE